MSMQFTAKVVIDKRYKKADNTYAVKLCLYSTELSHARYFDIPDCASLSSKEFERVQGPKPRGEYKAIAHRFKKLSVKAVKIARKIKPFDFDKFKEKMFALRTQSKDLFSKFNEYIETNKKAGNIGTAVTYRDTLSSLKKFAAFSKNKEVKKLHFTHVNAEFLNAYESWLLNLGRSITTVSMYTRNIRSIFNQAIGDGELDKVFYPFGEKLYVIPGSRKSNKSLEDDGLTKLYWAPVEVGSREEEARDYWFGMFAANGSNMKDIALLKYKEMGSDRIIHYRAKTINTTKKNPKPIVIMLTPEFLSLVEKYGNKNASPDAYIFPILHEGMTPKELYNAVQFKTKMVNKYFRRLAARIGVEVKPTTYWARHSRAGKVIRSGGTLLNVGDEFGHSCQTSTESYWHGYNDKSRKELANKVLDFTLVRPYPVMV